MNILHNKNKISSLNVSVRVQILFRRKFHKIVFIVSKILFCSLHLHVKLTTSMHGFRAFVCC